MIPLTKRACRQVIKQQRWRITELETQVADLAAKLAQRDAVIARLEQQVADLSAQMVRLLKNSSTSSKPPSSDIVKPPKPPGPKGGKPLTPLTCPAFSSLPASQSPAAEIRRSEAAVV
ncbi:MAG: hypothetical protein NTU53_15660 [Planctomycetota bacterium]|nr:hypothetical protein [Planctomycetota bacterium]